MGVINITPNSFSDPGRNQNINHHLKAIEQWREAFAIPDIGAESTAPFNTAVDASEEVHRLQDFFLPHWQNYKDFPALSFDTYKVGTFEWIYKEVRDRGYTGKIIWNDVSGKLDDDWERLVQEMDFSYIFSHNLAPSREETNKHQDFLGDDKFFITDFINYFLNGLKKLERFLSADEFYLDPCFGFSKTREQNWMLLHDTRPWLQEIGAHHQWLFGLSQKSFLHPKQGRDIIEADNSQKMILEKLEQDYPDTRFLFRVHKPLK